MASVHWIRKCHVSVGGAGLDMSNMQVEFQVRLYDLPNPDWCYIRMINLSDSTSESMFIKGAPVTLMGGYEQGDFGLLFSGTATQQRRGKLPNGTDKYHDVIAVVNRDGWAYGTVSKTWDAGATLTDLWQEVQKAFQQLGAGAGFVAQLGTEALKRAFTFHGSARDLANRISESSNASWYFDHEGKLNIVKNDGFIDADTLEINADTGMVGMPEQTLDGINVKIFLNPNVRKGQRVHIDAKSIQQFLSTGRGPFGSQAVIFGNNVLNLPVESGDRTGQLPQIAKDGLYKVIKVDHDGSMEGQEWYTTLICIRLEESSGKFGGSGPDKQQASERGIPEDTSQKSKDSGGGQ